MTKARKAPQLSVDPSELLVAIKMVQHAVGRDDSRPILTGILFEGHADGLRLVATDNYRLAIHDVVRGEDWSSLGRPVVPRDELAGLRAFLRGGADRQATVLARDGASLTFTSSRRSLTVRLIDGTYPDYMSVIRERERQRLGVNPRYLIDSAQAAKSGASGIMQLHVASVRDPILVTVDDDYREFIMPVRLGSSVSASPEAEPVQEVAG